MSTPSPNYGWPIPTDGGDSDVWGAELVTTLTDIDSQMLHVANQFAILSSGTFTASSAPTFGLTTGYKAYRVLLWGVTHSAAGADTMRLSFDGGATYKSGSTDYGYGYIQQAGGSLGSGASAGGSAVPLVPTAVSSTSTVIGATYEFEIWNPTGTGATAAGYRWNAMLYTLSFVNMRGDGSMTSNYGAATNLQFLTSTGNVTGNYIVYGYQGA